MNLTVSPFAKVSSAAENYLCRSTSDSKRPWPPLRAGVNVLVDDMTVDGLTDQERWNQSCRTWRSAGSVSIVIQKSQPQGRLAAVVGYRALPITRHSQCMKACVTTLRSTREPSIYKKRLPSLPNGWADVVHHSISATD